MMLKQHSQQCWQRVLQSPSAQTMCLGFACEWCLRRTCTLVCNDTDHCVQLIGFDTASDNGGRRLLESRLECS